MPDRFDLPSLKSLQSFEAAARTGSFKLAGQNLNVSASAISHQIAALERDLGVSLFDRAGRILTANQNGLRLQAVLSRSFREIAQEIDQIRRVGQDRSVSIGATTAVSSLWLTPKLAAFWQDHPKIMISQQVRDRPFQRPLSPDLVIEYAIKPPETDAPVLFGDWLVPLAAPGFYDGPLTLSGLALAPLIHLDAAETNWTSWPNWFASHGYTSQIRSQHRVNNYSIALQLAKDGLGIVLGWKELVKPLLADGSLTSIGNFGLEAPGKFFLLQAPQSKQEDATAVRDWLLSR
ncbi:MAG: LysR substrate-binding domain-containing protein [Pseudomonadota bacterium]